MSKTLILFPPTTKHLGLLSDIEEREDVYLFETGYRDANTIGKMVRKIYLSHKVNSIISLPNKRIWFKPISPLLFDNDIDKVLIIDGALNYIDKAELLSIKESRKELKLFLFMINALGADSPSINNIKRFVLDFPWDEVFTFDPEDACSYNMTYKGFCYYSMRNISELKSEKTDLVLCQDLAQIKMRDFSA